MDIEDPKNKVLIEEEKENDDEQQFDQNQNLDKDELERLKEEKRQRNRENKKNKKKNKKPVIEEQELTDYETDIQEQIKTAYVQNFLDFDDFQRNRLAIIECNPFNMILEKIPPRASESELLEYFNTLLENLQPEIKNPISSIVFEDQRQYGIVQFNSKESKKVIQNYTKDFGSLDYIEGSSLKLISAKQYFKNLVEKTVLKKEGLDEKAIQQQEEEENKIYMGSLPLYLNEEQIRQIAETYGPLKMFNLIQDYTEITDKVKHKGYCFFQYEDPKTTKKAIIGLDGLEVGNKKLKVQKASVTQTKSVDAIATKDGKKPQPSNFNGSYLGSCEQIKYRNVQEMLNMPESTKIPTTVVQFLNMVAIEDLLDDDIYNELLYDIKSECEKFGPVSKVVIPRPDAQTGLCPPSVGKVFVKFIYLLPAKKARHKISGRTYNKRTIIASFYPEERFNKKEYLINL